MSGLRAFLVVLLALSLLPVTLVGAQDAAACDFVGLVNGWARASVPGQPNGAAYGLLVNVGAADDVLVAASSDAAEVVELHEMVMGEGDVMQMRPLEDGIAVPAGGFAELAPGGLHVMLIGLRAPLVAGETMDLTLTFAEHGDVTLTLPVREADAGMAMGMDMGDAMTEEPMAMAEATPMPMALNAPDACAGVHFLDGWVRQAVPGQPNSAGYALALNLGAEPERIIGGATGIATVLELHEMVMGEGDVMQMRPLEDGLLLPPGEAVRLQPGGLHLMLIGLTGTVEAGDTVDVTLTLEQAGDVTLTLPVRDPNAEEAPMAMGN